MPSALPGLYDASPQVAKLQAKLTSMASKPGPLAAHYGRQAQVLSAVSAAPKGKKLAALTATLKAQKPSRLPLGQWLKATTQRGKPSGADAQTRFETGFQREIAQTTTGTRFADALPIDGSANVRFA